MKALPIVVWCTPAAAAYGWLDGDVALAFELPLSFDAAADDILLLEPNPNTSLYVIFTWHSGISGIKMITAWKNVDTLWSWAWPRVVNVTVIIQ